MAGRNVTLYVLICDGCGKERPLAETAKASRADAAEDGWTFPWMIKANGKPSARTNAVCPSCAPGFSPETSPTSVQMTEKWADHFAAGGTFKDWHYPAERKEAADKLERKLKQSWADA